MQKTDLIYEGKAKKVYATEDKALCVVEYKDDATAFNNEKRGTILGKGAINNRVSNFFMKLLETKDIHTHYFLELSERETLVRKVNIIPLEVIVRNITAGSLAKRVGLPEGVKLKSPVVEFCYKNDELGDPMVNDYHIKAMGWAAPEEISFIAKTALQINSILSEYLLNIGIELIDFKLEFGRINTNSTKEEEIILADEISPDTCRFWDITTHEKLDKDRFRFDLGGIEDAYHEIFRRLLGENGI